MSKIVTGIVVRDDSVWQGHPDVAFFKGKIHVVYRESNNHRSNINTKIKIVVSEDGINFSDPEIVLQSLSDGRYNCPRLTVIGNELWLCCDYVKNEGVEDFVHAENKSHSEVVLCCSLDGKQWTTIKTNIEGIVPDRICRTKTGYFLIGTHKWVTDKPKSQKGHLAQFVWKANHIGQSWFKFQVANYQGLNLCEGSFCNDGRDGIICLMRENSNQGRPAISTFSSDGEKWSDIYSTRLFGCHRPVMGRLRSGKFLVTYREQSFASNPGKWAKNTFACLVEPDSIFHDAGFQDGILLPIDHDSGISSDGGYTGWFQMDDDTIYMVNYGVGRAPNPFIKWYRFEERDF